MRLSEKTPVMAVVFLVLAVVVGLGLWYIDVRRQVETQQALEQTREAFERFERERRGANEIVTPSAAPAVAAPAHQPVPRRIDALQPAPQPSPAASSGTPPEMYYLLVGLLLTALVALALAGSSYRLVRRERRARMEDQHLMRETVVERGPVFRPGEGTIIDAETVETVSEAATGYEPAPPPSPHARELLAEWVDRSPFAVLLMRPSGEIEAVNPAFTRLTGYAASDLPNVQAWLARAQRVPAERQTAARDALRERYRKENGQSFETTVWTRAGEPLHWLVHTSTCRIDDEESLWLLLAADITDRRRTEIAAVERAEQAHHDREEIGTLYQQAPVGLAVLDTQYRFVRVNGRLAQMTGLAVAEHLGKPLRKLLPHVAAAAEPLLANALKGQTMAVSQWVTVRTPAKPKADVQWAVTCSPVRDDAGRIVRVALAAEDVTATHEAHAQLTASESTLRSLFEHLPAPICVKDAQGRYVYANPAYGRFVHAAPGQLSGRRDHEVLPWEAADRLRDADEEALSASQPVSSQGTLTLGEAAVEYAVSKIALRDPAGKACGVCAIYTDSTAQQRAERDVKAAEARYRAIFESSPQPMFIDRDNRLVHVNAACVKLLAARDERQLLGKSILEFIEQPGQQPFQERIHRVLRRKAPGAPLEVTVRRLDGTAVEAEIDMALYQTPGELAVQILVRDVTERKRADAALRESEAKLRRAAEETPALIRLANADGETVYCNAQWQRLTGLPGEQGLGQRWLEHVHPEDRGTVAGALLALRTQRGPLQLEYRLRTRGGAHRWMLDVLTPRIDDAGACLGYVSCATDIDARKGAESELRRDASRFRAVAERAPAMLWTESAQGVEMANEALRAELALAEGEDWRQRIHADDRAGYDAQRAQALTEGRGAALHLRVQSGAGEFRDMVASLAPDATAALVVGALTDVTELRRAQLAAQDVDARRNAFVSTIAAEMRAPLAPLRHAAEVLRHASHGERELQQASDIVVRHVQYLARLLEDAQDASQLLANALPMSPSVNDLGELVHEAVAAARPLLEARGIAVTLALEAGRAPVHADAQRIRQALTRLLDHCAQQAQPGETVTVSAEESDQAVVVHVTVGGSVMREDEAAALFELFPDEAGGRAAFTLPLVRRLIEANGGGVRATSTPEGLRYTIRLRPATATPQAHAGTKVNGHRRVLVVDRDPDAAASLSLLLQLQGHHVRIAPDRASVLPAVQEFLPDAIVIDDDGGAPHAGSDELARTLRLLPEAAHAALLRISAEAPVDGATGDTLYDHHLVKPVEPGVLKQALQATARTLH